MTSCNVEHLSICALFVDKDDDVIEEVLTFGKLERITSEQVDYKIIGFLSEHNTPVVNMQGQRYDRVSNISMGCVGVQLNSDKWHH